LDNERNPGENKLRGEKKQLAHGALMRGPSKTLELGRDLSRRRKRKMTGPGARGKKKKPAHAFVTSGRGAGERTVAVLNREKGEEA